MYSFLNINNMYLDFNEVIFSLAYSLIIKERSIR